jgi:glycerate dehydrogenase
VPEHTFALILALARSIVPYRSGVLAGEWQQAAQFSYFTHPIIDLAGRRLGLVGSGSLGGRVAELGRAFGMDVVISERKGAREVRPGHVAFDEVIETADVLSFHCPLTPETRGMVAMPEFRRMTKRPIVVNTARGGLVDEADLERALDEGLVGAAGLDVTLPEPPPLDSVIMRLAKRPNVIVTPHVAWASGEAQQVLADQMIDNIEAFVAGRPRNLVVG